MTIGRTVRARNDESRARRALENERTRTLARTQAAAFHAYARETLVVLLELLLSTLWTPPLATDCTQQSESNEPTLTAVGVTFVYQCKRFVCPTPLFVSIGRGYCLHVCITTYKHNLKSLLYLFLCGNMV